MSTDDDNLFRKAMANVRPLSKQGQRVTPPVRKLKPYPKRRPVEEEDPIVAGGTPHRVGSEERLEFRRNGISERVFRRLRSGRLEVEAELDLHGLTASAARNALKRFIDHCRRRHFVCVRVIHGRGLSSGSRGPVLKAEVNHQLRRWEGVLAFSSALPRDGGSGAVYVLLKRL